MPSRQQRANERWIKEKWQGAPELSAESKAVTASFPDLHLRVWCNIRGVQVVAYVDRSDTKGRVTRVDIARAEFRPSKVTEELVVDWGRRALARWLESRTLAEAEAQHGAA